MIVMNKSLVTVHVIPTCIHVGTIFVYQLQWYVGYPYKCLAKVSKGFLWPIN
jgi:hypothetical protein